MPEPNRRILIVGQSPGEKGLQGRPPLWGYRNMICKLLRADEEMFGRIFDTRNLIGTWPGRNKRGASDLFPFREARSKAETLTRKILPHYDRAILLGRSVWSAFSTHLDLPSEADFCAVYHRIVSLHSTALLLFPHPSGRNRWWNSPRNRRIASSAIRYFTKENRK